MVAGKPVTIEKVDDYTVRYVSENPYYTLPIKLASVSKLGGFWPLWPVRPGRLSRPSTTSSSSSRSTPARKPSTKMAKDAGFDNWVTFFLEKSNGFRNVELPAMTAWKLVQPITGDVWEYERNPYSIWMDEAGNQLPYIDRIVLTKGENLEVVKLRAIAGEYDQQARHIDLTKLPVLLENQETGDYTVHLDTSSMGGEAYLCVNASYATDPEKGKLLRQRRLPPCAFARHRSRRHQRGAVPRPRHAGLDRAARRLDLQPGTRLRVSHEVVDVRARQGQRDARRDRPHRARREGYRVYLASGKRFSVELMTYVAFMNYTALGEMIAEDFKDLGIEVKVVEMERTASQTRRRANEFELTIDTDLGRGEHLRPSDARSGRSRPTRAPGRSTAARSPARARKASQPPPEMAKRRGALPVRDPGSARRSGPSSSARSGGSFSINQWAIGTVGLSPAIQGVRVVRNNLGNIPDRQINSAIIDNPAGSRPEQWYFKN